MALFDGVYVAIVTPFKDDLSVDIPRFKEHINWLIDAGVDGIVPTGSCGEYASLDDAERQTVIETVAEVTQGRVPFVVGVAAPTTQKVVQWAQLGKRLGAQGLMALPPVNYRPTWEETVAHYRALDEVGIPIIIYNNPHDTAVDIAPERLCELEGLKSIRAVKEFSGDVRRITEIQQVTGLEVLAGADDLLVESIQAGATGWIAGMANIVPRASVELYRLARAQKNQEAWDLYRKLLPLLRYDSTPRLVQVIKYGMELVARPAGPTRPPRLPLADPDRENIRRALAALD
jgi:4-hydroxy-tetrahydrodipicolinate synthase